MRLAPSPEFLQELVARDDAPPLERELVEQPELGRRQLRVLAVHERLHLARIDAKLLDLDRLAAWRVVPPRRSSRRGTHPCNELVHRERLDEVVVRSDLERRSEEHTSELQSHSDLVC